MLSKTTLSNIAKLLKVDEAAFLAAAEATEEKKIEIPENLVVMTSDDLANRDKEKEKAGHSRGTNDALEKFIKEKKAELGLEFEGKDPSKFLEAMREKALSDAKVAPDEKLKDKDKTISSLQQTIDRLQKEANDAQLAVKQTKLETEVFKSIPTNLKNGMEPQEVLTLMKANGYNFEQAEDGSVIAVKNGMKVTDTALRPIPVKDVINSYVTERKWLDDGTGERTGRGEGSSKPKPMTGKPTKLSEAEAQAKEQGINPGTVDYEKYLAGVMKDNPEFDLNS